MRGHLGLLLCLIFTWNMSNLKILQGHWWWIRGWMWMLGTWKDCLWWIFSAIKLNRSKLWLWRNTSGLLSPDAVYIATGVLWCDMGLTWFWIRLALLFPHSCRSFLLAYQTDNCSWLLFIYRGVCPVRLLLFFGFFGVQSCGSWGRDECSTCQILWCFYCFCII